MHCKALPSLNQFSEENSMCYFPACQSACLFVYLTYRLSCLSLSVCLLSTCLSTLPIDFPASLCLYANFLPVCLPYLSTFLSLSVCMPTFYLPVYLPVCQPLCQLVNCLLACLCVCLSVCIGTYLSVCIGTCLSV